ncbi:MAG: hypothetical protein U1F65_06690 [Verrucomicrobiota bacterium]
MANLPQFARPSFEMAMKEWKQQLSQKRLPTEIVWIYDENLCFEKAPEAGGYRLTFQTQITPAPAEAERIAFDHFCDFQARVVFYRLGSNHGKSICLMLCDEWFESRGEQDGFIKRDDWLMSFRPGGNEEVMEINDEARWQKRIVRNRPLHDLDFCMTLQAVHETLAHGRVLTPYEQFALKVLGSQVGRKK